MTGRQHIMPTVGVALLIGLLAAACSLPSSASSGPQVRIESPVDGSTVWSDDTIAIRVTVDDSHGVAWVQLWVDGRPAGNRVPPTTAVTMLSQDLLWTASAVGQHEIQVIAQNNAGVQDESKPIILVVVEAGAWARGTAIAVQLATATPDPFAVATPLPGFTLTPAPAATPTSTPVTPVPCSDGAAYVADVTVPDGSQFDKGAVFNKTWQLRNTGTCAWDTRYQFVFVRGSQMNGPSPVALPQAVPAGGSVDVTVPMVAPDAIGTYRGEWQMRNPSGVNFGSVVFVLIQVRLGPTDLPLIARLDVAPATIQQGQTATIYWEYTNGTFARLTPGGEGGVPPAGSLVVAPNTTTNYRLVVNNAAGAVERTVTLTVQPQLTPTPIPAPTSPTNLAITATRPDGFDFAWTDTSTNEQGFRLYNADTRQSMAAFGPNVTTGAVGGLACQTPYRFYLVAYNAGGESWPGNTLQATTGACGGQPSVFYDFSMQAPTAGWTSGAGVLTFPGTAGDARGFARWTASETLEDGSRPLRALETDPDAVAGGFINGEYSVPISLEMGDRFEARVGLLQGAAGDVTFSVFLETGSQVVPLASVHDTADGALKALAADLSPYAGQQVRFRLRVEAGSQADQDRAVWVDARLVRP